MFTAHMAARLGFEYFLGYNPTLTRASFEAALEEFAQYRESQKTQDNFIELIQEA